MNQLEIERKWILLYYPQTSNTLKQHSKVNIEQYYDPSGFRYRWEHQNGVHKFYRLKKVKLDDGVYNELDIEEIKASDYYDNKKNYPIISKIRTTYTYLYESVVKFEVDDFSPLSLLTLEIELPSLDHKFIMPFNIASQILMEVTGKEEFSNKYLANKLKLPYVK